jgi:nucleolar protein 14
LKEYEEKGRSGGIIDRRFGENNPTLSVEERMLERFTKERQRASRGAAFNLDDEDDLTHYGQSLSKLDDFDDAGLGPSDVDEETGRVNFFHFDRQPLIAAAWTGQIGSEIVKKSHFGGFSDDEEDEEGKVRCS